MDLGLTDRVALVAASSRGLGRAVARELSAEGAHLLLCARGAGVLEETRAAIVAETGGEAVAVAADLSQPGEAEKVVHAALEAYGRVDVLVTNCGGPPPGPFESHDKAAWEQAVRQNLDSVVDLTRAALPSMKERGWGRIINITSIAVKQPVDNLILSNAVRAAVTGFAKTLANEVARDGITVNNVMPGYTRTSRLEELAAQIAQAKGITPAEAAAAWEEQIPMHRLGEPEEFAAMAAFLASDRASYITGTSIPVDGGCIKTIV